MHKGMTRMATFLETGDIALVLAFPFAHVALLGWKHTALTGDYDWTAVASPPGGYRPLRDVRAAFLSLAASVQFRTNGAATSVAAARNGWRTSGHQPD